jgi:hypothetical protein
MKSRSLCGNCANKIQSATSQRVSFPVGLPKGLHYLVSPFLPAIQQLK